jgi:hypothetical protein
VEQAVTNPQNTPYRAAFNRLEGLEERTSSRAWTSTGGTGNCAQSLTDRNPRPRYIAATGGDILLFLMNKVLPTRAVDAFWKRFYGINEVAKDWQNQGLGTGDGLGTGMGWGLVLGTRDWRSR